MAGASRGLVRAGGWGPQRGVRRRYRHRANGGHADGVAGTLPTDSSDVLASHAATVASGVNPPEQRPSVSGATAHRRNARPSSTAIMADADRLRALHAGDAGGQRA